MAKAKKTTDAKTVTSAASQEVTPKAAVVGNPFDAARKEIIGRINGVISKPNISSKDLGDTLKWILKTLSSLEPIYCSVVRQSVNEGIFEGTIDEVRGKALLRSLGCNGDL